MSSAALCHRRGGCQSRITRRSLWSVDRCRSMIHALMVGSRTGSTKARRSGEMQTQTQTQMQM